jgi:hypothetical protein
MRSMFIRADVNGRVIEYEAEVPPEWTHWSDEERRVWAHATYYDYVCVDLWWADSATFDDDADEWPRRWTPDGDPIT